MQPAESMVFLYDEVSVKKLVKGIVEFRKRVRPEYIETFARLALGQKPDSLLIACSDSRVVPNLFASVDPGDLFVVRNVGNLVAPCDASGRSVADESEASAIEFSVLSLNVADIIICGHSECGAMHLALSGTQVADAPNLMSWIRHANPSLARLRSPSEPLRVSDRLAAHNRLSQLNVLQQMEHVITYPAVRDRIQRGQLRVHGWWFDIASAEVYAYAPEDRAFRLIDDAEAERMLARAGISK